LAAVVAVSGVVYAQQEHRGAPKVAATAPSAAEPRPLWKTLLGRIDATPAVTDDGAIFAAAGKAVHSLDATGHTLWRAEVGATQSSPAVDGSAVYVGTDAGVLHKLDRKSGKVLWRLPTGNSVLTRPATGGGLVYAESTDDNVYGVDATTGVVRWRFARNDGSLGYSSPVYTPSALYVCGENTLYALDPATGQEKWRGFVGGRSAGTPALGGGRAYVGGDGPNGLAAFDLETGERKWSFLGADAPKKTAWVGAPLYAGGTVYAASYSRWVYAIDAATGKEKWRRQVLGAAVTRPALDEKAGVLYVTSVTFRNNPTLWALDAGTGRVLWSARVGYMVASPVLGAGQVLAGSTDGYLYAYPLARKSSSAAAEIRVSAPAKRTR
jgi:outer membrane protein assembly factor BamB